ncbi:MAG: hypothetical protein FD141_88 [Fusobacteria bacterium]|nr:MAG: hypothetical protein FD141_88 [Fusobacteriota bacterium]KAF0229248.1 MAG: hypothetical protein FD182_1504 [Fusobacteriota bacterium]
MEIEVLVATMNQKNLSKYYEMNLSTNTVFANQDDRFEYVEESILGKKVRMITTADRGVGKNRNNAIMQANSEICLFSDDDVKYVNDYDNLIINAFKNNPEADIILFNVPSTNIDRPTTLIKKSKRIRWYNSLRYGAVNIAIRTASLKRANVMFSLLFGGGAMYGAGEDSIFIIECLKKKLKVYTNQEIIGYVSQDTSSWFEGYNIKYFHDKGAWIANAFPKMKYIFAIYYSLKDKELVEMSPKKIYKIIVSGIKDFSERF